jgi:16S rRNA (uracil1498-N3)-methyltransferase
VRRFRIPESWDGGQTLALSGKDAHYLARVLRLKIGDSFPGMDAEGKPCELTVVSVSKSVMNLKVSPQAGRAEAEGLPLGQPQERPARGTGFTLFQCLPKGRKMDLIVRQATEAGVERIVPLESRFCEAKSDGEGDAGRTGRWARIAREALQQSGSLRPTRIDPIAKFAALPALWPKAEGRIGIFFHQEPLETGTLHGYLTEVPLELGILIGPEGGLSGDEIATLAGAGFAPAYLGPSILRTETAALYAIAAAQIILLEYPTWTQKPRPGSNG